MVDARLSGGVWPQSGGKSGAAAVKFLSAVFKFCCFLLAWLQTGTKIFKNCNLVFTYFYKKQEQE